MENKQYDSVPVAKYMLSIAGNKLNATQLQKLMFITYGFFLSKYGYAPLTETSKAWPFGPVFPRVQKHVNHNLEFTAEDVPVEILNDKKLTDIIGRVISKYSNVPAGKLSAWSHEPNSPWFKTVGEGKAISQEIPDEYIAKYFSNYNL